MTERRIQLIEIPLKLLVIVLLAWLYSFGGLEGTGKFWRRVVAPGVCGASLWYFTRDWRILIVMPFLGLSSSLGYGADFIWDKIWRRFYVGLAFGVSANTYNILKKRVLITAFTSVLIVLAFIVLGVFNPLQARYEETFLGLLIYAPVLLSANNR